MNISITGFGTASGPAVQTAKISGASGEDSPRVRDKGGKRSEKRNEKRNPKKNGKDDTAVVLSISSVTSGDRSKAITMRFQAMKDTMRNQLDSLNERLQKAVRSGNSEQEELLAESIKELMADFNALDEQLKAALVEEQQRKAEEAKQKEEESAQKREEEKEKYKPEEEAIKNEEKKSFEFIAKADMAQESVANNKIARAKLERSKGRLEGEMAQDAAAAADREQRRRARESELRNYPYVSPSLVPHVSDKTILTEMKRIRTGSFLPEEEAGVKELNRLSAGIEGLEAAIGGTLAELNASVSERARKAKEPDGRAKQSERPEEIKDVEQEEEGVNASQ